MSLILAGSISLDSTFNAGIRLEKADLTTFIQGRKLYSKSPTNSGYIFHDTIK
jgi:hypothetical protein